MSLAVHKKEELIKPAYDWRKFSFVWLVHGITLAGCFAWWFGYITVSWQSVLQSAVWFALGSTAITAGYHRLYSHPTYKATWPLELFYVLYGSSTFQGTIRQWSAQHRDHHTYVDQPKDPYNIYMGFGFAHMGSVVRKTFPDYDRVPDLETNPFIMFQWKFYYPLAVLMSFILPTLIGWWWWNNWLGALFMTGFVRLVIQWHMTFCVNSVAHYWGSQTYSTKHSARGSWWLAFITWGEMDHNFHHSFPNDFRTGRHWYDFDPGKWWISCCAAIGLASDIQLTTEEKIQRAIQRTYTQK